MPGAKTLVGYKLYHPGQIVMNRMQAWSGMFGACQLSGLVSPDYAVFQIVGDHHVRFILQRLKSPDLVGRFAIESKGIGSGFNRLYTDRFGPIPITFPPPNEQAVIVRFLDYVSHRLERAIRAKKKLIGLLNEQKQAIIYRAVTRGLDPDVRLKPSGVSWLGEIPEHWAAIRVSRFARVGNGSTPSRSTPAYWKNGTYPWLNSSQVNRGTINSADQFVTPLALRECHLPRVPAGSVLVAITGQGKTRATAAVLEIEATINQHIAFLTPSPSIVLSEFLQLAFTAAYTTLRALSEDSGSTKGALTCEDLKRFAIPLPPRSQQVSLVDEIRASTRMLDSTVTNAQHEIDLICEYQTRLIADVVTGQVDVRGASRDLPAETEQPDVSVEADAEGESEELLEAVADHE
jgi:type I restriction enzyme S subunit